MATKPATPVPYGYETNRKGYKGEALPSVPAYRGFEGTAVGDRDPTANRTRTQGASPLGTFAGFGQQPTFNANNPAASGMGGMPTTRTGGGGTIGGIKGAMANPGSAPVGTPGAPDFGSESGPGILEQWFNMRANGTDPAFDYALKRGTQDINSEFAARGGYNSGGALRRISDFEANLDAKRFAGLDSLAGGASGEHQRRLDSMFGVGTNIATGKAGLAGTYDVNAGNAMNQGNIAAIQLMLDKAGIDQKTSQGILDLIFNAGKLGALA